MSKVYTPFSLIMGLAAGSVAGKIFTFIWSKIDDEDAPAPKHREISYVKLVAALLVEGAITRIVRGFTDHGLRQVWARTIGEWPGEERPEPVA